MVRCRRKCRGRIGGTGRRCWDGLLEEGFCGSSGALEEESGTARVRRLRLGAGKIMRDGTAKEGRDGA